ncbi:hypothetical protein Tco_0941402 [Tanacetum coccineum]|uniref:Uncharacterized protein n=1 Tax=Tanacetum coccineum TaxID=301880 RepID=A0ABQ5DT53_9ASTR
MGTIIMLKNLFREIVREGFQDLKQKGGVDNTRSQVGKRFKIEDKEERSRHQNMAVEWNYTSVQWNGDANNKEDISGAPYYLPASRGADDSALLSRLLFNKIPGVPSSYYSRGRKRQDGECVKNENSKGNTSNYQDLSVYIANEANDAGTRDYLVGRKLRTRWLEDHKFYEAVILDYNPLQVCATFICFKGTDIAKISRKRSKPDNHGHGNGKENTRAERMLSKVNKSQTLVNQSQPLNDKNPKIPN